MPKVIVLFSRTYSVEVEVDDDHAVMIAASADEIQDKARSMIVSGHEDVHTGGLHFDGIEREDGDVLDPAE